MIRYLRASSELFKFDIVAYCFMPDHLHLVLTGGKEKSNLFKFVTSYKQTTGYKFKQKFGFSFWATSFYDRVLRENEKMKYVGQYVLLNPVKANLVESIKDYPYVGSFIYDLDELIASDEFLI